MVAVDFGRCFFTMFLVRPGQEAKWPLLISRREVEGKVINENPCRNVVRSRYVVGFFIDLFVRILGGDRRYTMGAVFGAIGMHHSLIVLLRWTPMIMYPYL